MLIVALLVYKPLSVPVIHTEKITRQSQAPKSYFRCTVVDAFRLHWPSGHCVPCQWVVKLLVVGPTHQRACALTMFKECCDNVEVITLDLE